MIAYDSRSRTRRKPFPCIGLAASPGESPSSRSGLRIESHCAETLLGKDESDTLIAAVNNPLDQQVNDPRSFLRVEHVPEQVEPGEPPHVPIARTPTIDHIEPGGGQ